MQLVVLNWNLIGTNLCQLLQETGSQLFPPGSGQSVLQQLVWHLFQKLPKQLPQPQRAKHSSAKIWIRAQQAAHSRAKIWIRAQQAKHSPAASQLLPLDTEASHGSQAVTEQAPAADAAENGGNSAPVAEANTVGEQEQGRPGVVRTNISQVLGSLSQAKGSITQAIGSIGQVIGGTPFSAFAQQSLRAQSHNSADDSESDQLPFKCLSGEPLSVEESRGGGSLTMRKSGPFGGRGVALGHMMAAQQQWRQDSFSKAQVCALNILGLSFCILALNAKPRLCLA